MGKSNGLRIASGRRGQDSSEYLVVLGAVLVIALIVVTLLASGINVSGPNRSESEAYWASTSPIKIVSSKMVSGTLILGLQNTGNLRIYLTGLSVSGTSLNLFHYYTEDNYGNSYCNSTSGGYVCDIYLQVGKVVYLAAKEAETCPQNGLMEFKDVVMTYRTKGISEFKLVGERPLVVPCSGVGANMTLVTFYGYVNDGLGQPVANANVTVSRTGFTASVLTNSLGGYVLPDLSPTSFALQAGKDAYYNTSLSATLSPNVPARQDFTIHSIPQFSFTPPTPDNDTTVQDITINLSIQNSTIPLANFNLNWNGTSYPILDPTLTLMLNLDDVAAIGDTASKAVDLSPGYLSNATIYGNTQLLLHMDENSGSVAYDESVNANNGTCYSGGSVANCSWTTGKSGSGIHFNGVNQYMSTGSAASLNTGSTLSVEFWTYRDSYGSNSIPISRAIYPYGWYLHLNGGDSTASFRVCGGNFYSVSNYVAPGSWTHLVVVHNGSAVIFYKDGELVSTRNGAEALCSGSGQTMRIGAYTEGGYYYNGTIDEVGIYNRSLSSSEVLAHYNSGKAKHADWDAEGKFGSAMKFDGVNDYVNVTRDLLYPYNGTIELWAKTNDLTSQKMILWSGTRGEDGWGGGPEVYFGVLSSQFYIGIADVRFVPLGGYADTVSPANLDWNHLALSWNADGTINTYMNGVRINSVVRAVPTLNKASWEPDVLIGRPSASSRYFNGSVDEVRIWNRTLSDSEVSQHYYGSLNKYAADKWLFQSTQEYVYSGTYSFQANLKPDQKWVLFSQNRTNSFNTAIMFMPPTPANNSEKYDILLNASLDNMTVRKFIFSANDTNTTVFDSSLVLAYNFDDVAAIGDSARKVTDVSLYGNNGTIFGNTVLLLHMDENSGSFANDSTVYRNNGTIYGAAWAAGKAGSALNFDGNDDYVNFGDPANGNLDMGTDNFTASFWFRGSTSDRAIISKKTTAGDVDAGFVVYLDSPGWHLRTRIANGTHAIAVSSARDYLNDNAWHYGTIIKSGNLLFVYVDGTAENSISVPSAFNINNSISLFLGKGSTGTWNGAIDEVAIHRRALTPSEVLSHYNAGVAKHSEWDPNGKWGSAMKLDGAYDYVNVSSPGGLNFTNQMTISAWTRADNLTITGAYAPRILNKPGSFEIIVNVPQYNGHSRPEFRITQSGSANYFLANNNITINGWTFVAFTYNGATVTSFINGAFDRNVSFSGNVDASASGLIIGARNSVHGFFNGSIDEVRIWNRSLSASEIQQQYYSNLAKYAPSKWVFLYNATDPALGAGDYFAWVRTLGNNVLATDSRNISAINKIQFIAPTPANATTAYDLNIAATLSNISLRQAKLSLNGANYTAYDESLVLAFNFDDVAAIGDSAATVKDVSLYGNNGAITGNTVGLWHFDEADGNTTFDESPYKNNGTVYGNTRLLMHFENVRGNITYDESAYRNNGTCYQTSSITNCNRTTGKSGNGLGFDGAQYVEIANSASINITGALTLEAWAYPVAGDYRTILSKGYYTSDLNYALRMPRDSEGTRFTFNIRNATGVYGVGATTTNNAWYHVIGTYNLTHACIYLNSQLANCSAVSGALVTNDLPLRIGRLSSGTNTEYFKGNIDEVAIYSVALNATDVLGHYNAGKAKHADWVAGKSGTALQFDGVDDYVNLGNSFTFVNQTQETWVKINSLKTSFITGRDRCGNGRLSLSGAYANWNFGNATTCNNVFSTEPLSANMWYHLVGTNDNGNLKLYINGVLNASGTLTLTPIITVPLLLGSYPSNTVEYFNGTIDEVGIYNHSLSASEVLTRYNAGRAKHADWDADGKWGSAMKFDGKNATITVPDSESLRLTSVGTVSAWVNPSTLTQQNYSTIVTKANGGGASSISYALHWRQLDNAISGILSGGSSYIKILSPLPTDLGWHQLVFSWNGSTMFLYQDGILQNSTAQTTNAQANSAHKVKIGGFGFEEAAINRQAFNGSIDEVRIWNRSLSAAEIQQQYYGSLNKFAPNSWVFRSDLSSLASGNYTYRLWAQTLRNVTLSSDSRTAEYVRRIGFFSPTPATGEKRFVGEVPLNATILNVSLSEMKLDWNGTNYSFYDGSLVLNYGFDDIAEIGENGTNAVDTSRYGNNGTVYGDGTHALLHFDENESGTFSNYGSNANNARMYGDTLLLLHMDDGKGPAAADQSGYGRNGILYGSDTALLLHMDENSGSTLYDESAYGNNGTCYSGGSAATCGWGSGKTGSGINLIGTSTQLAVIPHSQSLNITGPLTIEAWFKTAGTANWSGIVNKITPGGARAGYMMFIDDQNKTGCYFLYNWTAGISKSVASSTIVTDNAWHHCMCTYDGTRLSMYMDGALQDTENYSSGEGANTEPLRIGSDAGVTGRYFTGSIDEVGVYSRGLYASDAADHYSAGRAKHLDWVEGKTGTGIAFDGINDYVNITNQIKGNFSQISAEMWFKVNDIPYDNYLLAFGYDANYKRLDLKANATGIYLARIQGIHNNLAYVASRPIVGQWHHVAYTFAKNSQARLYFDGQMVANATTLNIDFDLNSPLGEVIGGRFNGAETLNGTVDEVAVYNRTLSDSEVLTHYQAGRAKHLEKAEGKSGQGLKLDGTNDYVNLTSNITVGSQLSISAWFRTNVSGGPQSTQMPFATWFSFCYATDKVICSTDSSSTGNPVFGSNLDDDRWHHLVLSSNGTNAFGYVDGSLAATWSETLSPGSQGLFVGKFPRTTGATYPFNGNVDEVAVINRTLSADEVSQLYSAGRAHSGQWSAGRWDGAMRFDGVDDYVYVPVSGNVSTIEYWIYSNSTTGAVMDIDGANRVMLNALLLGNNATTYINGVQADLSEYTTGSELVQNGGFEGTWTDLGDGYSLPPEWTRVSAFAYPQESSIANTGNKSLRLGAACCAEKRITQAIPIVQGNYYLYSVYSLGQLFRTYVINGFTSKDIDPPAGFKKYTIPFVASSAGGTLTLTNAGTSATFMQFDDVSVKQVTSPVQLGVWTHVALVLDEPITTTNITIGKVGTAFFNGSLDEVRIWNHSLSAAEVAQHYYGSLNKYAPNKWAFQSAVRNLSTGNYTYMLYANNSLVPINSFERRTIYANPITFSSPTPANSSLSFESNVTMNATLATPSLFDIGLNWNGTNYTFLNESLILAYNFDDAQPLDTAARAADHSRYGNNGTIIGNTIALWHFDENTGSTVYDESAYKNNGTCYSGGAIATCSWSSGKSGAGISFDGIDDYVLLSPPDTGNTTEVSVFVWMYQKPNTISQKIIKYKGILLATSPLGQIFSWLSTNEGWHSAGYSAAFTWTDGWHQIGLTYRAGTSNVTYYRDGIAVYSPPGTTGPISLTGGTSKIGTEDGMYFNGTIDEVLIANRTLSAAEVLAQYNAGKAHHADWEAEGKFGSAIKFDGKSTYVRAPTSFTGENYTWSAWVKTAKLTGTQHIIGGRRYSYWEVYGYGLALEGTELNGFLETNGDTYFYQNLRTDFSSYLNAWTHVALTWNNRSGCTGKLYVNGALAKSVSHCMGSGSIYDPGIPYGYHFTVGAYNCSASSGQGPGYFFNGSIDEVRVWNRTLTDAEITQQYYGSLNKYAPDKWMFVSNEQELESARQNYFIYARDADGTVGNSELRTLSTRAIIFRPPTPANATTYPVGRDSTVNATIQNVPVSQVYFGLNNTNYTFLNESLVLALDFEDSTEAGDTASKATDYSQYGNNGTIYGNTQLLLHFDEADGNTTFDESAYKSNGTIYGNTKVLLHMDEGSGNKAYDESAYRVNGTISGATWTSGKNGSGLRFDGVDDYVGIPTGTTYNSTTVSAWFKGTGYSIISSLYWWGSGHTGYRIATQNDSSLIYQLFYQPAGYNVVIFSNPTLGINFSDQITWHHAAMTFNKSGVAAYLDGDLVNYTATSITLFAPENNPDTDIGRYTLQDNGYFNGSIDEVSIYSETLSAQKVRELYDAGRAKFVEWTAGKSGTGMQFDGIDDYVQFNKPASLNPKNELTLEAWIKPLKLDGTIIGHANSDLDTGSGYALGLSAAKLRFYAYKSAGNGYFATTSDQNITVGSWTHVAATFGPENTTTLYINGALDNQTQNGIDAIKPSLYDFIIGAYGYTHATQFFNGTIDEVGVYNRTLSAAEIAQHYNANKAHHANWDPNGRWGSAMKFDGVDDYVTCGNDSSLGTINAITVSAWIKPLTSNNYYLTKDISAGTRGWGAAVAGNQSARFWYYTGSTMNNLYTDDIIPLNQWAHIVNIGKSDGTIEIYVNGVLSKSGAFTAGNINTNTVPITVSGYANHGSVFNGSIDEVRVWNRTLSAAEIQMQYYSNLAKYGASKWLFTSNLTSASEGSYAYQLFASNGEKYSSQSRSFAVSGTLASTIQFMPPTPANGATAYASNISINATLQSVAQVSQIMFNWDGTNYTMYNDSLVLAYNFDDVASIGDTAGNVTDASSYGNTGKAYGNTLALLKMGENAGSTAYDEGAYQNNGTCVNSTGVKACTWSAGKSGTGIYINGSRNEYVNLSRNASVKGLSAASAEIWYKASALPATSTDIYFEPTATSGYTRFAIAYYTNGSISASMRDTDTGSVFNCFSQAISLNTWYHLAVTMDAGSDVLALYINGSLNCTNTAAKGAFSNTNPATDMALGAFTYSLPAISINGTIDEFVLHNRTLTASEVLSRYNMGAAKHSDWDPAGRWGSAMKFDGIDDYIKVATTGGLEPGSTLTLEAWINPNTVAPAEQTILRKGTSYLLRIKGANLSANMHTGGSWRLATDAPNAIPANAWTHVAVTYNGTNIRYFKNGADITPSTIGLTGSIDTNISEWYIISQNGLVFNGSMDEIRVWNRSLSQAEIQQHYYSNVAKYGVNKWLFSSERPDLNSTTYSYYLWASNAISAMTSEQRSATFNGIQLMPPTPANAAVVYINNITINASIRNLPALAQAGFSWNGANYTAYNDSLVLAYNFDDVASIGDSAAKVADASRYGNNGTIYGNTLGLWHFDENSGSVAYDESVNRNNGTINGATWNTGKSGYGLAFDGVDDYVVPRNESSLYPNNTITVGAWVKIGALPSNAAVCAARYPVFSNYDYGYNLLISATGAARFYYYANSSTSKDVISAINLPLNQWHHIVGVRDGGSVYIYVDGVLNGSSLNGAPGIYYSEAFVPHIGRVSCGGTQFYFNGSMDEVAVYNRSLSASEVLAQYNAGRARHADWTPDGKWGSAMKFDGSNDYVGSSSSTLGIQGKISVTAWVKTTAVSTAQKAVASKLNLVGTNNSVKGFSLYIQDGKVKFLQGNGVVELASASIPTSWSSVNDGSWHFIAGTYDSTTASVFVDGILEGTTSQAVALISSDDVFSVGNSDQGRNFFNGSIDEVRIWNRSLTAAEIQQQYYSNIAKYAPDRWLFTSVQPEMNSTTYNYYVWAANASRTMVGEQRSATFNGILFAPPTPASAAAVYSSNITINASIQNTAAPTQVTFSWNGANYTAYNDSLVLAYNFDDVATIGDSAAKVVDISKYGNNGAIYGNTLGLWHFDENTGGTVYDDGTFRNNGTINGAAWAVGKSGSGLQFDGTNDYVSVPHSASQNPVASYSFEIWFKANDTAADRGLFGKWSGSGSAYAYWASINRGGIRPGGISFCIYNGSVNCLEVSGTNVSDGNWHQFIGTYSATDGYQRTYIDGQPNATKSRGTGMVLNNSEPLVIGRGYNSGYYFNGSIDEFGMYNRTLSADEALARYNAGRARHADWTLDGKYGSAIKFDGKNVRVNNSGMDFLNGQQKMTISMWIKADSLSALKAFVSKFNSTTYGQAFGFTIETSTNPGTAVLFGMQTETGNDAYGYTVNGILQTGIWTQLTMVFNGTGTNNTERLTGYVNGVGVPLYYTGNIQASVNSGTSPLLIGRYPSAEDPRNFNGSIDEVRIWNRSLTAAEVRQQYYSNIAKYAPDKWLFTSVQPGTGLANGTTYAYSLYMTNATGTTSSEPRALVYNGAT